MLVYMLHPVNKTTEQFPGKYKINRSHHMLPALPMAVFINTEDSCLA